jgi:hypothetical protein
MVSRVSYSGAMPAAAILGEAGLDAGDCDLAVGVGVNPVHDHVLSLLSNERAASATAPGVVRVVRVVRGDPGNIGN